MYSGGLVTVGQGDACWLGVGTVAGPAPNQVALFLVIAALAKFAVERARFDRALRPIGMNPAATSVAGLIHEGRHAVISDEPYPLEDLLAAARPLTAQPMAEGFRRRITCGASSIRSGPIPVARSCGRTKAGRGWAMDITYIPMPRGFVYLAAVIDWCSRRMLAWRVSITMDIDFCIEAVEDAIARYGTPEIFNTDQGSQFTSQAFTGLLKEHGITISMDGKGCLRDNVFIERLWKSLKYEEVYLHAYDSAGHARGALLRYLDFYNRHRTAHLIGSRPIRSTSTNRCPVRRQLEPAGDPLIGTGLSVQTNGASSQHRDHGPPALPQRHGPPPA